MGIEEGHGDRLTRLETAVESIAHSVASLAAGQRETERAISIISEKLSGIGKWDAKTVLVMLLTSVLPLLALWAVAISPIKAEQVKQESEMTAAALTVTENRNRISRFEERFAEIEMQVNKDAQERNLMHQHLENRVRELWDATFKRQMYPTTEFPASGQREGSP